MSGIRIAHINDWAVGFGECPECGRRFIGLTKRLNLSPHKKKLPAGEKCTCRTPINSVVYLSSQQKMHPTKNGCGKSDKISTPAVFGG